MLIFQEGPRGRGFFFSFIQNRYISSYTQDCKVSPPVSDADLCRRRTWRAENSFSIKESRIRWVRHYSLGHISISLGAIAVTANALSFSAQTLLVIPLPHDRCEVICLGVALQGNGGTVANSTRSQHSRTLQFEDPFPSVPELPQITSHLFRDECKGYWLSLCHLVKCP